MIISSTLLKRKLTVQTRQLLECLPSALVIAGVLSVNVSAHAQSGAVAGAFERNVLKRMAASGEASSVRSAERAALAKLWRDLDSETLAAIERRFGRHIGAERMSRAGLQPATIMDRAAFDKHLMAVEPSMSEARRKQILGYYFDKKVVINGNQMELPLTTAHERLHQLSHPGFRETFGGELNEGITETFARDIYRDIRLSGKPEVYANEQRVVSMLGSRVGEERLARAYFNGEFNSMREVLDADLGKGTFNRFSQAIRSGDIAAAEAILR